MLLGISYNLAKKVEYFNCFKKKIVIVNLELSLDLDPLILKIGSIPLDSNWGLRSLTNFHYFAIISILPKELYLVK